MEECLMIKNEEESNVRKNHYLHKENHFLHKEKRWQEEEENDKSFRPSKPPCKGMENFKIGTTDSCGRINVKRYENS